MRWMLRFLAVSTLVVGVAGVVAIAPVVEVADASGPAKKKVTSCTLLTAAEIEDVIGAPVSGPGEAGTLDIACDFDIGPGLGDPGGGMVIVSYYTGSLAKGVWSAAKAGEKNGKSYWDPIGEIASGAKRGKMVSTSVTYTGGESAAEHAQVKEQSLALLAMALKKL